MTDFHEPLFRTRVVPNFWPRAEEARQRYEKFMGDWAAHGYDTPHRCWDYWYLPNVYCYLRAKPQDVLGVDLVQDLNRCMIEYSQRELPGIRALAPWMSLHVNGMRHEIHNDGLNGTYAYVYSLTRDHGRFTGGETCVVRGDTFDKLEPRHMNAWHGYMEVFPPAFNQLVLFDDRLPHMVPVVQGTMNPLDGRVCLTGHMK